MSNHQPNPNVRLITLDKCQAFVDCYTSLTEEGDNTDEVIKNKMIKFNSIKFKTFQDELKTLLYSIRGGKGIKIKGRRNKYECIE